MSYLFNVVLWSLDHMDGSNFEKLCTDLMSRSGYPDIIPVGGMHDRGRDAQAIRYTSSGEKQVILFQFSLNKSWNKKLSDEIKKIRDNKRQVTSFVFVTSQTVTGAAQDKFELLANEYGWDLQIYDRTWLRLQLEERHLDLAKKYLAIPDALLSNRPQDTILSFSSCENSDTSSWLLYKNKKYEEAALGFKKWLTQYPKDILAWQGLASCFYRVYQYKEALFSINEALRIDPSNRSSKSIKASILTEDGISSSNRANLLAAKELFKEILRESDHWFDYYNYGNVLSALDEPEEALTQYLKAVRLDNHQPELWKNMGSVYNTLGQHDEELRCFDKALELDENLAEAYISKGVTFLQIFNKAILGIQLIEQGLNLNPEIGMRWPHVWYWLALGYLRRNKKIEALNKVEAGLTYASSHQGLLELKASILSELWRKDRKYASLACRYFQFLLEYTSGASQIVHELIELSLVMNKEEQGWMYIEQFYHDQKVSEILKGYGYSLSTAKNAVKYYHIYRSFRDIKPIEQYDTEFGSNVIFKQPSVISSMDLLFNVIFGMGCTVLERRKIEAHHIKKMVVHIRRELAEKIPYLCRSVEIESEDQNFKIELLTQVCVDFPLLGLLESSRQTGYIGGYYGIPNAELDHYIIDDEITTLQSNIVSQSFLEMNRRLHLFLEETEA